MANNSVSKSSQADADSLQVGMKPTIVHISFTTVLFLHY